MKRLKNLKKDKTTEYHTNQNWMEHSVSVDISTYKIDPFKYGARIYILILLICEIEESWKIWENIYD